MADLLDTYLTDPETWHRVTDAAIRVAVKRITNRVFDLLERRPRRRAPRHRKDG